jgi:Tfp pilus assembly protein PilF
MLARRLSPRLITLAVASGMLAGSFSLAQAEPSDAQRKEWEKTAVPINARPTDADAITDTPRNTVGNFEQEETIDATQVDPKDEEAKSAAEANADIATSSELALEQQSEQAVQMQEASQHYYLANSYLQKWELNLAEVELEEAIKLSPDMKAAHRDLCVVSMAQGNVLRGIAEFMMVTGLGEPVPYTEEEGKELDKKALVAHYKKGLSYARKDQWKEAITELEWANTYGPEDFAIRRSLAFAYANVGDFVKAEQQYETTFKLAPQDGTAHADLAAFLQDVGKLDRAQEQLEKAVELTPHAAALHVDLGWVAESRGDLSTASQEFKTAVELSPKHANLWAHLGRILERKGDRADAIVAYNKAIEIDPDQEEAKASLERLKNITANNTTKES